MRAILGVVSLLLVLAVVGTLAMKQLKAVDRTVGSSLPPAQAGTDSAAAAAPASAARTSAQRVGAEVVKSLEQGAARSEAADK
jgi:hypothetical protein